MRRMSDDGSSGYEFGEEEMGSPMTEADYHSESVDHPDILIDYRQQLESGDMHDSGQRMSLGWSYNPGQVRAPAPLGTAAPLSKRRRSSKQECFIEKLYKMATSDVHSTIFGFSDDGSYIEIRTPAGLAQVLNQYFKHSNTSSFIRQLNNYGFKTMSSVSTGKNIQCFTHPQFRKGFPEELAKITRKTARILKKCKREIIKDLQTGEAVCKKRVKELEVVNSRLESEVARLERENAILVRELAAKSSAIELNRSRNGAPGLASNASSFASSLGDAGSQQHQMFIASTPSRSLSPLAYQGSMFSSAAVSDHLMYLGGSTSSFQSLTTASRSSSVSYSESGSPQDCMSPQPGSAAVPPSMESYYFEPVLEMVSDYSDESPLLISGRSRPSDQFRRHQAALFQDDKSLDDSMLLDEANDQTPKKRSSWSE